MLVHSKSFENHKKSNTPNIVVGKLRELAIHHCASDEPKRRVSKAAVQSLVFSPLEGPGSGTSGLKKALGERQGWARQHMPKQRLTASFMAEQPAMSVKFQYNSCDSSPTRIHHLYTPANPWTWMAGRSKRWDMCPIRIQCIGHNK